MWVLLFFLLCSLSLIFIDSSDHAVNQGMQYFWTLATSISFAMMVQLEKNLLKLACLGVLVGNILLISITLLEFSNPNIRVFSSASNYIEDQQLVGVAMRIGGMHLNPNINGLVMVLAMFVTFFFVFRGFRFVYTIIVGVAVFATVSRGAILLWVLACILLYSYNYYIGRERIKYGVTVLFVVSVVGILLSGTVPDQLEKIGLGGYLNDNMKMRLSGNFFSQEDTSSDERESLVRNALSKYMDSPVVGTGLGSSAPPGTTPTHNLIAKIGVELGAVGIFLFYFGLVYLTVFFKNHIGTLFLVVFSAASLFSHNLIEYGYFAIFLAMMVVLFPTHWQRNSRRKSRKKRRRKVRNKRRDIENVNVYTQTVSR
jgi:hypothetical protein